MQGVVGATIRKARTDLGLSQAAFARALGFSSEFISLLEADKRTPSLATLNKIAAYHAVLQRFKRYCDDYCPKP